jgi:hypothetical protein
MNLHDDDSANTESSRWLPHPGSRPPPRYLSRGADWFAGSVVITLEGVGLGAELNLTCSQPFHLPMTMKSKLAERPSAELSITSNPAAFLLT